MRLKQKRFTARNPDILVIDGMNLCYRAAFSLGILKHGDTATGVIYGCLNMIKRLADTFRPSRIIIVWEGVGSRKLRQAIYPEYKAHRKQKLPFAKEVFYSQVEALKEVLYYLGIDSVEVAGFEADDVIAVLSRHFEQEKFVTTLVSTDQDLLQLINEWVNVWNPSKEALITVSNFREHVGIDLKDFVDYKSLVGDTSDNIKGVAGIGEKGALEVCDFFGLSAFLELKLTDVKSVKLQKLLTPEGLAELQLAKSLIDLSHVSLTVLEVIDKMNCGCYDMDEARDLLIDYDMWSILDNWNEWEERFTPCRT